MKLTSCNDQAEILALLKTLMLERMSGTTVMPIDEAENLLQSLLYLLKLSEQEMTVTTSALEKFTYGQRLIQKKLTATKQLYAQVRQTHLQLPIDAYQNLLPEFDQFFKTYDYRYAAHQTGTLWIDYQLAFPLDDRKLLGIDFAAAYLNRLLQENLFCRCFSVEVLLDFFACYSKQVQLDYRIDVTNVYERIFFQAFGRRLAGAPVTQSLIMTQKNVKALCKTMTSQTVAQLEMFFISWLKELGLKQNAYYQASFQAFLDKWTDQQVEIETLFILERSPQSLFSLNEGLLSNEFTAIVKCAERMNGEEQVLFLLKEFSSIYDYLDFFELPWVEETTLTLLFQNMNVEMLAVFIKWIMREERMETPALTLFVEETFSEKWQQQLQTCVLKRVPSQKLATLLSQFDLPPLDFD